MQNEQNTIESRESAMKPFWAAERASLKTRAELRKVARANGLKKFYPRAGWSWDLDAAAKLVG